MSAGPRFLVSGYYGFGNTGDEAMLAGLIEGFGRLCPAAELMVLSGNPGETVAEHGAARGGQAEACATQRGGQAKACATPLVRAAPRGLRSAWREMRRCDGLISGGGGLLQDVTSWRSPLYYLAVMGLARRFRRPVACIGQSIGPLRRGWVRALVRREIGRAAVVAVRDELSQRLLSGLGVSRAAEVTADLAFLLPAPTEAEMAAAREKAGLSGVSEPLAAIALRRGPGRSDQEDVLRMAGAIGKGCEALGLRPLLVAMQPSQDAALAEAAAGAFPGGNALIASGLRAREMLALVGGCQMVIGMRLHALIFAALCRLPLVAISYDPKVDGLLAQLGVRPAADLRRAEGERLAQAIGEAWREREGICRGVAERLPGLRSLALRNVELALRLRSGLALSVLPRR